MREQDVNPKVWLHYLAIKNNGKWADIFRDLCSETVISPSTLDRYENDGTNYVVFMDEGYPITLSKKAQPPFLIYYNGNIDLIKDENRLMSILNDNLATMYAYEATEDLCLELIGKMIFVIQFGQKRNNDLIEYLINHDADVVAVLDRGIDVYDKEYIELYQKLITNHLVISEFPPTVIERTPYTSKSAVKLLSSVSKMLLVGGLNSRTVQNCGIGYAVRNGTIVMCAPYTSRSKYENNKLIKQGAYLVEYGDDVLEVLKRVKEKENWEETLRQSIN